MMHSIVSFPPMPNLERAHVLSSKQVLCYSTGPRNDVRGPVRRLYQLVVPAFNGRGQVGYQSLEVSDRLSSGGCPFFADTNYYGAFVMA